MPPVQILLIAAACGAIYISGKAVGHGVKVVAKKTDHAIVRIFHPHRDKSPKKQ